MTELMQNAWLGWRQFTDGGKVAAILLAALLYLYLSGFWKKHGELFLYTAIVTVFSIVPITAVLLMLYQTRFYDYEWIWSLVPMNVAAAWGMTEFLGSQWKELSLSRWRQGAPVTLLLLAALLLSGGLGQTGQERREEAEERQQVRQVLTQVWDLAGQEQEELCLWAPQEVLKYAREEVGDARLLYGRNMWEEALNAYSYDTYSQETKELYLWMENVKPTGEAVFGRGEKGDLVLRGADCVTAAAEAGVNCILLPESLKKRTVERLSEAFGGSVQQLEDYYLLIR